MLECVEIVKTFNEENIPDFPIFENKAEFKSLLALHLEKNLFDNENYVEKTKEIFKNFGITDSKQILKLLDTYKKNEKLIDVVLSRLNSKKSRTVNTGTFTYPSRQFIYYDNDDDVWRVDIRRLQEEEAKYDDINITIGKVIIIFDPRKKDSEIVVDNRNIDIRVSEEANNISAKLSKLQQNLLSSSVCTCGNNPCTCGANISSKNYNPDYTAWDELMQKIPDSGIILIFNDGKEILRY